MLVLSKICTGNNDRALVRPTQICLRILSFSSDRFWRLMTDHPKAKGNQIIITAPMMGFHR
jgi:hypothetical protein